MASKPSLAAISRSIRELLARADIEAAKPAHRVGISFRSPSGQYVVLAVKNLQLIRLVELFEFRRESQRVNGRDQIVNAAIHDQNGNTDSVGPAKRGA